MKQVLLSTMFVLFAIVGCAAPTPTATPLPTTTPVPSTATSVPPTPTPAPSATATRVPPTATQVPPTATPIKLPSPTPRPKGWITVKTAHAPDPRVGQAMTVLSGGRILLPGGRGKDGKVLGDTWVLGLATKAQLPGYNLGLVLSVNLVGGLALESRQYLQAGNTDWTKLNPSQAPAARANARMFTGKDGQAYLIGGEDEDGGGLMDLHIFDPKTLDWKSVVYANTPPPGRYSQGGIGKKDGKMILYSDLWRYDYATRIWEQLKEPPNFTTTNAAPLVQNGKAYLLDVHNFPFNHGTIEIYDMINRVWEQLKLEGELPPGQRSKYVTVQNGNNAYMFGGALWDSTASKFNYTKEVWTFDLNTLRWKRLDDLPFPMSDHGSVYDAENKRFVIWGGQRAVNEFFDDVWSFLEALDEL
ncbi:MAG: hypothetical protein HZB51_16455 [Chloroflexi bacterium]|nr:hypothetical protein [Chloroflexota bacterium]